MKIGHTEIEVVRGSVLDQNAQAIINAANRAMRGGGALDGAIHRAAGPNLRPELEKVAPHGAQTGEVVVTSGHNMKQKHIFHIAGPIWKPANAQKCEEQLAASYRNGLIAAQKLELESLAFPSLSTGVYSFPIERAAPIALETTREFLKTQPQTSLKRVIFALYGGEEFHVFRRALEKLKNENDS